MTDTSTPSARAASAPILPFMDRLERMRRRARFLLVLHGLLVLACAAVVLLLGLCALDYAFWFPAVLRLGFALAWIGVIVWLLARSVVPALLARFVVLDVATKIEQRFPEFQDRLTSSVSFLAESPAISDPLRLKLLDRTEGIAASLPLEQAISPRAVWRMLWLAALPALLLGGAALLRPAWVATGIQRYAAPLGHVEWPTRVLIEPLTDDITIASGESVVLAMNITRGQDSTLRGFATVRGPRGQVTRMPLRREGEARYALTLPAITDNLVYWFEAGDDSTRRRPSHIQVVQRPEIQNLRLTVWPPAYVTSPSPRLLPGGQRFLDLIEGSAVELRFRSSKPLGRHDDGPDAAVLDAAGGRHAAVGAEDSVDEFLVRLQPETTQVLDIRLVDSAGFENAAGDTLTVEVRADAAPRARLLRPSETLQVTASATVRIAGAAEDDLGLGEIALVAEVAGRPASVREVIGTWTPRVEDPRRISTEFSYDWSLHDLRLEVGHEVSYGLVALDNRVTSALSAQEGHSHKLTLRVVSPQALAASIGHELQRLARRLRGFGQRQQQVLQRAETLYTDIQDGSVEDSDAVLMGLSAGQRGLAQQLGSVRRQAEALSEQLDLNDIVDTPENQQTARFAEHLRAAVEPTMQDAAARFNSARGRLESTTQLGDMAEAIALQRQAQRAIQGLLKELAVWDDYNSVMAHLRRLIDIQQQVSQQTAILQERTLGRNVEELSEELRQELQRSAAAQDRISVTLKQALEKLRELEAKLRASRPDEARALDEARRRLAAKQATALSERAADAIRRNQTGQAQINQNRVERALSETVSQLENTRTRQLAELTKKLALIEELLQTILGGQRELLEATRAASDSAQLPELAPQQAALRRNASDAAARLDALEEQAPTGELAHLAVAHMAEAIEALYAEHGEQAADAQTLAIQRLERALAELQEHLNDAEQQLELQNLLATRRVLQSLRRRQLAINTATRDISEAIEAAGQRTRGDVRRAKKQGRAQVEVLEATDPLVSRLDTAPVYLWVLERVRQAMGVSRDHLQVGRLTGELVAAQDRALALLDQLIEAINQAQQMAEAQFAAGGGGGGGSGGRGRSKSKPVPEVAELLVLKAVQQDIQRRTLDLAAELQVDSATESQLQTARNLGREQAELKQLTILLTEKARHP